MPRHCTIPELLNMRRWFEKNYGMCCRVHDANYAFDTKLSRKQADRQLLSCMWNRSAFESWFSKWFIHRPFILAAYSFVRFFGWMHYKK